MTEHEIWLTKLFNDHLAGLANTVLGWANYHTTDPARPWENWLVMELAVFVLLVIAIAVARTSFSVDKPGKAQHILEVIYDFLKVQSEDVGVHHSRRYLSYFGTLFIFILGCNLIGIIPGLESPTMFPQVPAAFAVLTFLYYNWMGLREQGPLKYALHFAGPVWWLSPLMLPIEIVSHLARPLSLTIRLYANMFAGEQVTLIFLHLTFLVVPALFMGLHVFVAVLQAYIFALLTMIYVSSATSHEH